LIAYRARQRNASLQNVALIDKDDGGGATSRCAGVDGARRSLREDGEAQRGVGLSRSETDEGDRSAYKNVAISQFGYRPRKC
jgi:hypothetical protein